MESLSDIPAAELLRLYATGAASPVEAVEACLQRIDALDGDLGAFVTLCPERARADAHAAEDAWRRGEPAGPLCGVPLAVKDLFDTAGIPTECGSRILAGRVPDRDAEAVRRARAAGAVVIGKTSTVEFAWGLKMVTARNPWDRERTPGGSSGGSAVAVATGMAPLALGTDTGGSIRLPASLCGIVGFKPTHGAVSLDGCWPLSPSLDHAGPMTRTPADAALLFGALQEGSDPFGSAGPDLARGAGSVTPAVQKGSDPFGVGVVDPLPLPAPVRAALERAARVLGAEPVEWPDAQRWVDAFGPIQLAEALEVHRRAGIWPQRREDYTEPVRRRVERAEGLEPGVLQEALVQRERLRSEGGRVFERVDLLLGAVCAEAPPPRIDDPGELRQTVLALTTPADLLGLPACTLRAGFDDHGVPIGVQIMGPPGADEAVLAAAQQLYDGTPEIQARRP